MLDGWLTYGNENFRWEFDSIIEIRPSNRKMNKILVEFNYHALLKFINNRLKDNKNLEISHIPPEFISKAIKKTTENNWNSKDAIGQVKLNFTSNGFEIKKIKTHYNNLYIAYAPFGKQTQHTRDVVK